MSPLPPRKAGTLVIPMVPPVSAIFFMSSSDLARTCWFSPAQTEWLATTGRSEAETASRLVRLPECATSTMTPTRFISATAA